MSRRRDQLTLLDWKGKDPDEFSELCDDFGCQFRQECMMQKIGPDAECFAALIKLEVSGLKRKSVAA